MAELTASENVRAQVEHTIGERHLNLASEEGRAQADAVIAQALEDYRAHALTSNGHAAVAEALEQIGRELRDDLLGIGATLARMLLDPVAQEWSINAPDRIFRDNGERIERVTDIVFPNDEAVRRLVERAIEQVEGKRLDRITPMIEARLPDGSRLSAAIPPVSSNRHVIVSIRLHRIALNTLDEYVEAGSISRQAADFLAAAVRARKKIIVCGAAGSGKTTLLNALGEAIPGSRRVVVCEAGAELKLPELLHNCVGYEARPGSADGLPAINLDDLVRSSLRATPATLVVGEVRGREALDMVIAFATGHSGLTSVHGETCEHAIRNLSRFIVTAAPNITSEHALDWLSEIDLIIHCRRPSRYQDGIETFLPRRVDEIVEIQGVEGNRLTLNPLFHGEGTDLHWLGSGPRFLTQLEEAGFNPQ
jgi:pilus assembly protein CpaF